jgi:ketosteroid isomerase-like protein
VTKLVVYWNRDDALADLGLEAMPEESTTPDLVELTRHFVEAANRLDFDAVMSFYAPDAVWESVGMRTSFEGRTAIRGLWEDVTVAYEEFEFQPPEILDLGNGVIFGVDRSSGRLVDSTGRLEYRYAIVTVWGEGLIVRVMISADIDEARAAAKRLAEERG